MIIVLHGEESFLTKRKRDQIVAQYRGLHPRGEGMFVFEEGVDLADVKAATETISLFDTKKLVICFGMLAGDKELAALRSFLERRSIKEDKDTVVVFSESIKLEAGKKDDLAWFLAKPALVQESAKVAPAKLFAWMVEEAKRFGAELERDATSLLLAACGNDLWRLSSELAKLAAYSKRITKDSVRLLVASAPEGEVFPAVEALAAGDAKTALRQFRGLAAQGEDWVRLFAMVVFQYRNLLKVKSLLEQGVAGPALQKATGMHPFALRKTLPLAKRFTLEQLKAVYRKLFDIDLALKTGKMSFDAVVEEMALKL